MVERPARQGAGSDQGNQPMADGPGLGCRFRRVGVGEVDHGASVVLGVGRVAARWGRWATAVAVAVPCLYAATRWAWALGIPLGISEELLREGQAEGIWLAGASLATVAVGGAVLTRGLVQEWGEVFPRWIPFLAGRRVPPALAIVPASVVSVVLIGGG